jgi:hypothetical protein
MGSPPPATSKKEVLKFLSVKIIVIPPANTGSDSKSSTAVTTTAHPNKASLCNFIPGLLIFSMVVIKFIAPSKLLIPERWRAKIAKSTLGPLWLWIPDKGGYRVHPVPAPFSIVLANKNNIKLGGSNQKLILFNLGKAMSGPPTNNGSKKLPNPPIIAGIIMKNIIIIAWAVIILLYSWLSAIYCTPGPDNSSLINTENAVPNNPANRANIRYSVPISFALLDKNQRSHHKDMSILFSSIWGKIAWEEIRKWHPIATKRVWITPWNSIMFHYLYQRRLNKKKYFTQPQAEFIFVTVCKVIVLAIRAMRFELIYYGLDIIYFSTK